MSGVGTVNDDIFGVIVILLSVLVVLANISVCTLVVTIKQLRTYINGFVVSLAVSDTSTAVLAVILLYGHKKHKELFRFMVSITILSEIGNLCAVSYERYLAVVQPFYYKTKIKTSFRRIILSIWTISLFLSLGGVLLRSLGIERDILSLINKFYVLIFVIAPFVYMIVIYIRIFREMKLQKQRIRDIQEVTRRRKVKYRQKREMKIVKIVLVVVVSYVTSWIPFVIHESDRKVRKFALPGFETKFLIQLFTLGLLVSALINPFMYTFVKQDFRTQIARISHRLTRRRSTVLGPSSVEDVRPIRNSGLEAAGALTARGNPLRIEVLAQNK